jgi:hypothetical protein
MRTQIWQKYLFGRAFTVVPAERWTQFAHSGLLNARTFLSAMGRTAALLCPPEEEHKTAPARAVSFFAIALL